MYLCHNFNEKYHKVEDRTFFDILICKNGNIYWKHDVLAKNMMHIASQVWAGQKYSPLKIDKAPHIIRLFFALRLNI